MATLLLVLALFHLASSNNIIDLTSRFSSNANSTCTPPSCSNPALHQASSALDSNSTTWWQSDIQDDPVLLSLTTMEDISAFSVTNIVVIFRSPLPDSVSVLIDDDMSLVGDCAIGNNSILCTVVEETTDTAVVEISIGRTVQSLHLLLTGFEDQDEEYFSVAEINVRAMVLPGYYFPGPHHVRTEAESGVLIGSQVLKIRSDMQEFPGFSGSGYTVFNYPISTNPSLQLMVPIPQTASYKLVARYISTHQGSHPLYGTVQQSGGTSYAIVFRLAGRDTCTQPCYIEATLQDDLTYISDFALSGDQTATIILSLERTDGGSGTPILLDYVAVVPEPFFTGEGLLNSSAYSSSDCGVLNNALPSEGQCSTQLLQISSEFYTTPFACSCSSQATNQNCEVLGGQCTCSTPSTGQGVLGRACDTCPVQHYINGTECIPCGCPSDGMCNAMNGQCECADNVEGRTCDRCIPGSYGEPPASCMVCSCDSNGTDYCNSTTGECICVEGAGGSDCSECVENHYMTTQGCQACMCDNNGSAVLQCNNGGVCMCQVGYTGDKCSDCINGHFRSPVEECLPCECSQRTSSCRQNENITNFTSELCDCPPQYSGDSCQLCSSNHYLTNGTCQPCQCNGSFVACDNLTGQCLLLPPPPPISPPPPPPAPLNCTPNTTGRLCDSCAEGYYSAGGEGELSCPPCPCHENTTTNSSCVVVDGSPICHCKAGHTGSQCNICTAGYFGQPPQFPCSTCECSGNIDPQDENACNRTTGVCINCLNNTTGPVCGACAEGYYGNATEQSCQMCQCNPIMSQNLICHPETGECSCLSGVLGPFCNNISNTTYNFTISNNGSLPCDCDPEGSESDTCHPITGQCLCKNGVGNRQCTECLPGFYNMTQDGCTDCQCGAAAVNTSCRSNGECFCADNSTGIKCDQCDLFHTNIGSTGCEPCDECVTSLRVENMRLNTTLDQVDLLASQAAALQNADTLEVSTVVSKLIDIRAALTMVNDTVSLLENRLVALETQLDTAETNFSSHYADATNALNQAERIVRMVDQVFTDVSELYNELEIDFISTGDIRARLNLLRNRTARLAEMSTPLNINLTDIVDSLLPQNITAQLNTAESVLQYVIASLVSIQRDYQTALNENNHARTLMNISTSIRDDLNDASNDLNDIETLVNSTSTRLEQADERVTQLTDESANLSSSIIQIQPELDQINDTIATSCQQLEVAKQNITRLTSLVGSDSTSASGSGEGDLFTNRDNLAYKLQSLLSGLSLTQSVLDQGYQQIINAVMHSSSLQTEATYICSTINMSSDSVQAIMDLTMVNQTIQLAIMIAMETNETLNQVTVLADMLMEDNITRQASMLLDASQSHYQELITLNNTVTGLLEQYETAKASVLTASQNDSMIAGYVTSLNSGFSSLNASYNMQEILTKLELIRMLVNASLQLNTTMTMDYNDVIDGVSNSSSILENVNPLVTQSQQDGDQANITAAQAETAFENNLALVDQATELRDNVSADIQAAMTDMGGLRNQLLQAREAALSIDVALRFHGNSTAQYQLSEDFSTSDSVHVSVYFRPESDAGVLLSSGGTSLAFSNGSVSWNDGSSMVYTPPITLSSMQWYHALASSDNGRARISLTPLLGGDTYTGVVNLGDTEGIDSDVTLAGPMEGDEGEYFTGCVDRIILNHLTFPLLSSSSSFSVCGPRPAAETAPSMETGAWFQGAGSYQLPSLNVGNTLSVSLELRTFASEGVILQITETNNGTIPLLSVSLSQGQISMTASVLVLDQPSVNVSTLVNDGEWHSIVVLVNSSTASLTVDDLFSSGDVIVSSIPSNRMITVWLGSSDEMSGVGFAGCMRNVTVAGNPVDFSTGVNSRVIPAGCPAQVSRGVRFMGEGLAVFNEPIGSIRMVSFQFRSSQLAAVLVYMSSLVTNGIREANDELVVSLYHTHVRVDFRNLFFNSGVTLMSSQGSLNDGLWHSVTVSISDNPLMSSLSLSVDDQTVYAENFTDLGSSVLLINGPVGVGGIPSTALPQASVVHESFRGCMRDLRINSIEYNFNRASSLDGVALYGCRQDVTVVPTITPLPSASTPSASASTPLPSPLSPSPSPSTLSPSPSPAIVESGSGSGDQMMPVFSSSSVAESMIIAPSPAGSQTVSSQLTSSALSLQPTVQPTVTTDSTEEIAVEPTPSESIEPTEGVFAPSESIEPTEGVSAPSESIEPTEGVTASSESIEPTEGVIAPSESIEPTEGVTASSESIEPTEGVIAPSESIEPTEGVTASSEPTEGVIAPSESIEPTEGVTTPSESIEPTDEVEPTEGVTVDPSPSEIIEPEESTSAEAVESTDDGMIQPTLSEVVEPTDEGMIQPTPSEAVEPTEGMIQPTLSEAAEPTDEGMIQPTPSEAVEPTDEGMIQPTPSEAVEPTDEGMIQPTPSEAVEPTDEGMIQPTLSEAVEPTDEGMIQPTPSDAVEPTDEGMIQPTLSEAVEPTDEGMIQPTPSEAVEPTDEGMIQPTPSEAVEPTDEGMIQPTPSEAVEPTDEGMIQPTPSEAVDPSPSEIIEPEESTSAEAVESTDEGMIQPTPSEAVDPTDEGMIQPTPSEAVEPTDEGMIQPTPSEAVEPTDDAVEPTVELSSTVAVSSTTIVPSSTPSPPPPPVSVSMNGSMDAFLAYSINDSYIADSFNITMQFRTGSTNAILLYTQGSKYVDYTALELRNGHLFYSFNLGGGAIFINTTSLEQSFSDNNNHTVTLLRNRTIAEMIVDGNLTFTGQSRITYTQLDIDDNPLYVGGLSRGFVPSSLIPVNSHRTRPPGIRGCFYSLYINSELLDLGSPIAANGLMIGCPSELEDVDNVATFNRPAYYQLLEVYHPMVTYGVSLEFRTTECSGLLLYSASLSNPDHSALELHNGTVRFVFDNGAGAAAVEHTPTNLSALCDSNWHSVRVLKNRFMATLWVDSESPVSGATDNTNLVSVDIRGPLYAGGVPSSVVTRQSVLSGSFSGCMRDVAISNSNGLSTPLHFSFANSTHFENVDLNVCSLD